ncbi:MAG: polysaccharide biosynthesis/export family protein [Muribaculaceae bacterium]|nr:polysaccharide biosynthesis/export family protein [Muribaculaceae bacterium]MDE6753111.1 polysaccharide biosynthesis/export family protein [Muribaculaceae bacterium]
MINLITEMIGKNHLKLILSVAVIALTVAMTGCKTPKNVAYFQDVTENVYPSLPPNQIKIEPNDRLSIVVKTSDVRLSQLFNKTLPSDRLGEGYSDYIVTPEGMIDFPILGPLKVAGMNRSELAGFIKGELIGKGYAKDPVVTVDIINLGFSVLGEVNNAGYYGLIKDEMNVLEALANAGDLTIQGQRENVKVIRRENDGIHTYSLDLTNLSELHKSPGFYVKQGDVIYVEPNGQRKRETTTNGNAVMNVSFWVSVASLLTTVIVLIKK